MSNIQVVVRCRGRNPREVNARSPVVVDVTDSYSITEPFVTINNNQTRTTTSRSSLPSNPNNPNNFKTYKVDQVYGSQADQSLIFEKVALPLFDDFMSGYNVTILAYGQTSTGKTYTMCGEIEANDENAGIIPRVLTQLFSTLEEEDYVVKCSFLELYNEDLRDLLGDDGKMKIYGGDGVSNQSSQNQNSSNSTRKSIVIQNLKEEHVVNRQDGFKLLQRGLMKRKTASTKLNDVSSRSHTIFTINLYRKTSDELFKVSKMNLVDLAGSENIHRSGAVNQRAKEAGSINQSLLTLGRVINCLAAAGDQSGATDTASTVSATNDISASTATASNTEPSVSRSRYSGGHRHSSGSHADSSPFPDMASAAHIPYRESKLTRLLQDSLGGNTKTTLIATISPAKVNIDETISTLDYASKAKSIKNVPQSGSDSSLIMKKVLVKNLSQELSKLTYDLMATRSKNGVWLDEVNYNSLTNENESLKTQIKDTNLKSEALNTKFQKSLEVLQNKDLEILQLKEKVEQLSKENHSLDTKLTKSASSLVQKEIEITTLNNKVIRINDKYNSTTIQLTKIIYENLTNSINSISSLLRNTNRGNCIDLQDFNSMLVDNIDNFKNQIKLRINELNINDSLLNKHLTGFLKDYNKNLANLNLLVVDLNNMYLSKLGELKEANEKLSKYIMNDHLNASTQEVIAQMVNDKVSHELASINVSMQKKVSQVMNDTQKQYSTFFQSAAQDISTQVINQQKSELLYNEKSWSVKSSKLFNLIDNNASNFSTDDLVDKFTDISSNLTENIGGISTKSTIGNLEEMISEDRSAKFEARLMSIKEKISHHDAHYKKCLTQVNYDLNSIKQFDAKNALQISPFKQMERSSSFNGPKSNLPSPSKPLIPRSSSVSPRKGSKIPQLLKSFENKENLPVLKRRKIAQEEPQTIEREHHN